MKYDVNFGKEFKFRGESEDRWLWATVEAESEELAAEKVYAERNAKYIISVCPSDANR